ncbi:MAG TPA: GNAT family N-acetyltransferase [Luteolibacter sp.]|nr:GNAT family N-acetyltransferase [Luteolibacter sp.]
MALDLRFEECRGDEITARIRELGRLRIAVFRDYPYLYDGDENAEREYLRTYAAAAGSYVCLASDGREAVGATTCVPMTEAEEAFRKPFADAGWDLTRICYFGESVLLPGYRGRGVGREFFRRREAEAARLGLTVTTFCAVDRPAHHPARPRGYRPLDDFWESQGYLRCSELQAVFPWKETGADRETDHTLTFWIKEVARPRSGRTRMQLE